MMKLETPRLLVTDFTPEMARAVHLGSLDNDTRAFLPDEVFEMEEIAAEVIRDLVDCYGNPTKPQVHPVLLAGAYIGYVQLVPTDAGWEIGYHTVEALTGQGFATEAVRAFLPEMAARLHLTQVEGICLQENAAAIRVLEKCGFLRVYEGDGLYQGRQRAIVRMVWRKEDVSCSTT